MPTPRRNLDELRQLCAQLYPDDGVNPREDKRREVQRKKNDRKLRQLCKQVANALQLSLAELATSSTLTSADIREVQPAPNAGRLRVIVVVDNPTQLQPAQTLLERLTGRLRADVAAAISRRKTPELIFEVITEKGTEKKATNE